MAITLNGDTGITLPSGAAPAFSAYASANQTVTLATPTKVAIDTEFFDTNSNFDTSLYRFTPTVAGYYQINGVLRGRVVTTFTSIAVFLFKNGSNFRRGGDILATLTANQNSQVVFSEIVYMNGTTDYLELYGQLGGTGTATFEAPTTIATCAFSACLVRSA